MLPRPRGSTSPLRLPAALAHARDVLADAGSPVLNTDAAWTESSPRWTGPSHKLRLEKLFAARSIFDTEGRLQRAATRTSDADDVIEPAAASPV